MQESTHLPTLNKIIQYLDWQEVKLIYQVEKTGELPRYKGSAWRGMFGHLLMNKAPELYDSIFECRVDESHPMSRRFAKAPNPYVAYVPAKRTQFEKGERFQVRLKLIGEAIEALPQLIYLLMDMGGMGMGREELPLSLVSVSPMGKEEMAIPNKEFSYLRLKLETPLQIKVPSGKKEPGPLPFPVLIHRMVERAALMAHFHGKMVYSDDFQAELALAREAYDSGKLLHYCSWDRRSNRTGLKNSMGGLVGQALYGQVGRELAPLLDIASQIHLGKGATWGMGKLRAEFVEL